MSADRDLPRMIRFASLFVFLLLSYHLVVQVRAATVSTHNEETLPDCVNGHCSKRTLFQIVRGCLTTILICAWTAVHPDIPPREGSLRGFLRRLHLLFWAIVAPEILPCWALNQLLAAITVRDEYNERKGALWGSFKEDISDKRTGYANKPFSLWSTVKGWVSVKETTGQGQREQ